MICVIVTVMIIVSVLNICQIGYRIMVNIVGESIQIFTIESFVAESVAELFRIEYRISNELILIDSVGLMVPIPIVDGFKAYPSHALPHEWLVVVLRLRHRGDGKQQKQYV